VLRTYRLGLIFSAALVALCWWQPAVCFAALLLFCYDVAGSASRHARKGLLMELLLMPISERRIGATALAAYAYHAWIYVPALILLPLRWVETFCPTFMGLNDAVSRALWALTWLSLLLAGLGGAVLAAVNLAYQGHGALSATALAFVTAIELGAVSIAASYAVRSALISQNAFPFAGPLMFLAPVAVVGLFSLWYFPRYSRGLRDALFEDPKKKRRNL
jgi:hypothetical protein